MSNTLMSKLRMYLVYILLSSCQTTSFPSDTSDHMPVSFNVPTNQKENWRRNRTEKKLWEKRKEIKRGEKSGTTYNKGKIGDGREKNQGCQIEFLSSWLLHGDIHVVFLATIWNYKGSPPPVLKYLVPSIIFDLYAQGTCLKFPLFILQSLPIVSSLKF